MLLLDELKALGVDRSRLPENINEFFGTFGSERQNVIKACDFVRNSPLIGPKIPVHGLMMDMETGKLDWVVNGYDTLQTQVPPMLPGTPKLPKLANAMESLGSFKDFALGEMKFPEVKIGELATKAEDWQSKMTGEIGSKVEKEFKNIAPMVESVESVAGQVAEFAEKNWPKPPPVRLPPPLPPMKKKAPPSPPIRPGEDFRRR